MMCQGQGTGKHNNKTHSNEHNEMNHVGIDVSSKELVVVMSANDKQRKAQTFENTAEGHLALCRVLHKRPGESRVCMEATGVYHFDLAVLLSRSDAIKVMVINPKAAHSFAKALMKRSKTDNVDASVLASYAERMPFIEWKRPSDESLGIRALARRIAATNKIKTQVKNQLHSLEFIQETPEIVMVQTKELIKMLDEQVAKYRESALEIIQQSAILTQSYDFITSIKGIADASAIQLLGELLVMPSDMTIKQWVAFAGLDPRQFESGSSVSKKPRISKAGNKYIRQALYMPALVSTRFEPHIKAYYEHLQAKSGLRKMQALCAVMRKLLHAIYGMLKNKLPFDGQKFFNMPTAEYAAN